MKPYRLYTLVAMAGLLTLALVPGCSEDSGSNNTPQTARIYMELKAGSVFNFDRTDLDTANNEIAGSTRRYTVELRGSGNLILGAYRDWFYRIGTDQSTNKKDTLYIRTNTGSSGGTSFTKAVQVYGFATSILAKFADMVLEKAPFLPRPSISGPTWDDVAVFHKDDGTAMADGYEWTIGTQPVYSLNFGPGITVNISIKGTLQAKNETFQVGAKTVKAWKTCVTVTAILPIGDPVTMKIYVWYSDDPDGQVQIVQQSAVIALPIVGSFVYPGEKQKLVSYTE
ncbi:MAG: hypothetical protein QHI48_00130 [Bacteroidota bacterium]|nr:hypothetical protein [Bacteroidota bacterium]